MIDNYYLRLVLIVAGAFVLYYVVTGMTGPQPVENEGTMSVGESSDGEAEVVAARGIVTSPMTFAHAGQLKDSSPAVSPAGSCPQIARIGMPKKVYNSQVQSVEDPTCDYQMLKNNVNVLPYPQVSNNYAPQMDVNQQFTNSYNHQQIKLDCFPKDTLSAQDLLPREDGYNTWQEVNPQAQGHLTDQNFLEAGHHYGINTVGQSLKNANLQLRSDPVIPQVATGPWLQSTYEPDTNRRFFEIGQC